MSYFSTLLEYVTINLRDQFLHCSTASADFYNIMLLSFSIIFSFCECFSFRVSVSFIL